jgi:hypothetical protein
MNAPYEDWHSATGPALFDADFAAWLKSLSRKARVGEAHMHWTDLGPFTISAYGLHLDLIGTYRFLAHRNKVPAVLPDDCTPEGFYLRAVEVRREQVGLHNPFVPTPYERLSAFSQFIYRCMTRRIAASAGIDKLSTRHDGLDGDGDDGLGDGLDGAAAPDDGLEGSDGLVDDLDDGLGDGL